MKEIRIRVPKSHTPQALRIIHELNLHEPCVYEAVLPDSQVPVNVLCAEISTPDAKRLVDRLIETKLHEVPHVAFTTRELRSIVGQGSVRELTAPLVRPAPDVLFELWQHSHITTGFVVRLFVGAALVGAGMTSQNLLVLAAGLLFIPLLHIVLAIAFSLERRDGKLLVQALCALGTAALVLAAGGAVVALAMGKPMPFISVGGLLETTLLAMAIGVAGTMGAGDDVGRRELIGLATASQLAIVPVWIGAGLTHAKFDQMGENSTKFVVALLSVVVSSAVTFVALRLVRHRRESSALRSHRSSFV